MNNELMIQKLIEAVERADFAEGLLDAVKALAQARDEKAIPTLIDVLKYNNPGAAVAAVDGLIDLGEPVVPNLLANLDDYNYGARAWAIRVFAAIGDPIALDLLIKAASTDFSLSVRRAAAKGLGFIKWYKLLEQERLPAQTEVLKTLLLVTEDGEWVVRYAAVVGLQALYTNVAKNHLEFGKQILERFEEIWQTDAEVVVSARVRLALQELQCDRIIYDAIAR
jgi:phycocyanobilin lyase beta subunit